jgi:peptidyl-tRNA hydrolase ICT1
MHAPIRQSRYYAKSSNSLVIQADDSRKQADNTHLCYKRLLELIAEIGRELVPGETSAQQKARVKNL